MRWDENKLRIFEVGWDGADELEGAPAPEVPPSTGVDLPEPSREGRPVPVTPGSWRPILTRYLGETFGQAMEFERIDPRQSPAGQAILRGTARQRRNAARVIVHQMVAQPGGIHTQQLQALLTYVLRRKNEWDEPILYELIACLATFQARHLWPLPTAGVLRLAETYLAENGCSPRLRTALEDLRRLYKVRADSADDREIFRRLSQLIGVAEPADGTVQFETGEAWTVALSTAINALPEEGRGAWQALLRHAAAAKTATPSTRWWRETRQHLQTLGDDAFLQIATRSLKQVGQPGDPAQFRAQFEHRTDPTQVHEQYSDLLRGLVWCVSATAAPSMIPLLGQTSEICFERLPRQKPRSLKIAVACINSLAWYQTSPALQELVRLQARARQSSIKSKLNEVVTEVAKELGVSPGTLAELSVPDLELSKLGTYEMDIGKYTATITIESPGQTKLRWAKPGLNAQAAVPKAVKSLYATDLARLRKRAREINLELPGQRLRLERLLVSQACWEYAHFQRNYLDHRLIGPLARCLIWRFEFVDRTVDAIWHRGCFRTNADHPVSGLTDAARVTPWHPLMAEDAEIERWQLWIEQSGICQPFAQAHREVYQPDSHHEASASESDRFAGYFAEHWRMEQIAESRNWRLHDPEVFERTHSPYWDLPEWNLRACWHTIPQCQAERTGGEPQPNTGNVTFRELDSGEPVPVSGVPAIVYSEVMREIECFLIQYGTPGNFTQFASGNSDSDSAFRRHCWKTGFGPLNRQGQMRQRLLARLLVGSTFSTRVSLHDNCIHVQGQRDAFRIHCGSGITRLRDSDQVLHLDIDPFTARHTGLPSGKGIPRPPYGGDVRLASILRIAKDLACDARIRDQDMFRDRFRAASD